MNNKLHLWISASVTSVLLACSTLSVAAAEKANASGTWKWSFTMQDGTAVETTLKLQQDGEKLSGTITRRDGTEAAIEMGKVAGEEVSFQVTRERDGQKFVMKYQGKLSGDTLKGSTSFERDGETRSRDWEAKRAGAGATGTWKWTITAQDGTVRESTLKLKQEGDKLTGALVRRDGTETAIEDGKAKDGEVSFTVTRERNGQKFTAKYQGKLSGNVLKGTISSERDGQTNSREWEARREVASAAGNWKWTVSIPNGQTIDVSMKLKQEGDKLSGVVVRGENETPIQEAQIKDGAISFQVIRERDGQKFVSKYVGKLSGDSIKGKITSNWGGEERTFDWDASRIKE